MVETGSLRFSKKYTGPPMKKNRILILAAVIGALLVTVSLPGRSGTDRPAYFYVW